MPHGGMTVEELYASLRATPQAVAHAQEQEDQDNTRPNAGDLPDDDDGDPDGGPDGGPTSTSIVTDQDTIIDSDTDITITGLDRSQSEELINRIERVYFDVTTPEKFLDDFFTAFTGFAVSMVDAGLGDADFEQMLSPQSGFLNQMLNEFIGEQVRRARESNESPYELVGVQGDPVFEGEREGDVSTTDIRRMTRTEAESQLRREGIAVTEESIQSTIDADFQSQQNTQTVTSDETTTTTEDTTDIDSSSTEFVGTEQIFSRPRVEQVFKFSPADFLAGKFGSGDNDFESLDDEAKQEIIGRLSTQIRAAAPRSRPGGGGPTLTSISARRT